MIQSILEAVLAALKTVPIINSWVSKTPSEQLDKALAEDRKEMDGFRQSGKPQ